MLNQKSPAKKEKDKEQIEILELKNKVTKSCK